MVLCPSCALQASACSMNRRDMHFAYILYCRNNTYYCGITNNIHRRLQEHRGGLAKSTKYRRPVKLVCVLVFPNKSKAAGFEQYIKSHSGRVTLLKRLVGSINNAGGRKTGSTGNVRGRRKGFPGNVRGCKAGSPGEARGCKAGSPGEARGCKAGSPGEARGCKTGSPGEARRA